MKVSISITLLQMLCSKPIRLSQAYTGGSMDSKA